MEKHLLVTVSEQLGTIYSVRFVGGFFSNKKDLELTLLYIEPKPVAVWEEEDAHDIALQIEKQAKLYEEKGHAALEATKKNLLKVGFDHKQIRTKLQIRKFSKVMDIIQQGEKGLYDAVVLGPRGLSWLERAFDESVSKAILDKKVSFPIWLCRKPDVDRKNVLLCVDGSEPSFRMADHVGFILSGDRTHGVTVFVVAKNAADLKKTEDAVILRIRETLTRNGYPEDMISTRMVEASDVAKAIRREAEQGRYAVVGMGRTGAGQGRLQKLFMGSVSDSLFHQLEGAALWICH